MGRYEEKHSQEYKSILHRIFNSPTYVTEIKDTQTGDEAKGKGDTRKEANKDALDTLKNPTSFDAERGYYKKGPADYSPTTGGGGSSGCGIGGVLLGLPFIVVLVIVFSHGINTVIERDMKERKREEIKKWNEDPENIKHKKIRAIRESIANLHREKFGDCIRTVYPDIAEKEENVWVLVGVGQRNIVYVAHSPDKGKNWEIQLINDGTPSSLPSPPLPSPLQIVFLNEKEGFLLIRKAGGGSLYTTNDSGKNWKLALTTANSKKIGIFFVILEIGKIIAKDLKTIIIEAGDDCSFITADGGKKSTFGKNAQPIAVTLDNGLSWEIIKNDFYH